MTVQWERAKGNVDEKVVEAIERKIGYRFPLDYISVMKEQNGARPVQYRFDV